MASANFYFIRSNAFFNGGHYLPDTANEVMRNTILVLLTAAVLVLLTYIGSLINFWPWSRLYLIVAGFLVFLTVVSDQINLKSLEQEGRAVVIPYLVSTILKLIFSAIFLILLVRNNLDLAKLIVFAFLPYYAVFSTLEIIIVNRRTRAKKF